MRQNLSHFANAPHKYLLILSGDQLYRMNFRHVIEQHIETGADVTVATIPVNRADARRFGIMQIDGEERITRFEEKPKEPALLDALQIERHLLLASSASTAATISTWPRWASMFSTATCWTRRSRASTSISASTSFPDLIKTGRLFSYVYQGYWEDIGTIRAFFDANLDLTNEVPQFNFFDTHAPIYTHARFLPASKIVRGTIERAVISDGCIIVDAQSNTPLSASAAASIMQRSIDHHGHRLETDAPMSHRFN